MSKEKEKRSESESITFRIPTKLLNELRQESEKKQMSLNTLTNQIFTLGCGLDLSLDSQKNYRIQS